jgi:hypothetical protein
LRVRCSEGPRRRYDARCACIAVRHRRNHLDGAGLTDGAERHTPRSFPIIGQRAGHSDQQPHGYPHIHRVDLSGLPTTGATTSFTHSPTTFRSLARRSGNPDATSANTADTGRRIAVSLRVRPAVPPTSVTSVCVSAGWSTIGASLADREPRQPRGTDKACRGIDVLVVSSKVHNDLPSEPTSRMPTGALRKGLGFSTSRRRARRCAHRIRTSC